MSPWLGRWRCRCRGVERRRGQGGCRCVGSGADAPPSADLRGGQPYPKEVTALSLALTLCPATLRHLVALACRFDAGLAALAATTAALALRDEIAPVAYRDGVVASPTLLEQLVAA